MLPEDGEAVGTGKVSVPLFLLLFFVAAPVLAGPCSGSATGRFAVLQGPTTGTTTQLAILAKTQNVTKLWLLRDGESPREAAVEEKPYAGSEWVIARAIFSGLSPGKEYQLVVCGEGNALVDKRTLATLDTTKNSVRFAVASCMDDGFVKEQKGMWDDLASHRPEMLFLIGDNTYADFAKLKMGIKTTPEILWDRHTETRNALQIFRQPRLIPIFATWDDHDYGANDGDSTYPNRTQSLETYDTFFPRENGGPGRASAFSAFGQRFVLLDDRYFRTKQSHFGKEGDGWLKQTLSVSNEPAWLMNGDQFYGGYHRFESFEGNHRADFTAFVTMLRGVAAPVFFVSGDRHLAELMEIGATDKLGVGYRTYELTTSAIHAKTFPNSWAKEKNPRQLAGESGVLNYAVIESKAAGSALDATVTAYGPAKRVLFRRAVTVKK